LDRAVRGGERRRRQSRRVAAEEGQPLRSGGVITIDGAVVTLARQRPPDRRARRAPLRREQINGSSEINEDIHDLVRDMRISGVVVFRAVPMWVLPFGTSVRAGHGPTRVAMKRASFIVSPYLGSRTAIVRRISLNKSSRCTASARSAGEAEFARHRSFQLAPLHERISVSTASLSPTPTTSTDITTFDELSLSETMRRSLAAAKFATPTPIQAKAIPAALAGRDVIGAAQTGTGKTAAFLIPMIERLRELRATAPHACGLVLSPTRELAEQTLDWARRLGSGLSSTLIVGGVGYGPQLNDLRRRPAIIVATPGRLVDHLERRTVDLRSCVVLVLDEADRMLDMGFKPQLDRIMAQVPKSRQTMLFSATMPADLGALARMQMSSPVQAVAGTYAGPPTGATQDVYLVNSEQKLPLLKNLVDEHTGTVLVFARTKHRTDRLARVLKQAGHSVERLHADRSQSQRRAALLGFRDGRFRILVATDIAARGVDVEGIGRVINFDLPQTVEDYVHRVGRTARAERTGHASSFVAPDESSQIRAIERHIGRTLPRQAHAAIDHNPPAVSEPRHPAPAPSNVANRGRRNTFRGRSSGPRAWSNA